VWSKNAALFSPHPTAMVATALAQRRWAQADGKRGGGDGQLWVVSRGGAAALAFIAQRRSRLGPCDSRNSVPINRAKKLPCWGSTCLWVLYSKPGKSEEGEERTRPAELPDNRGRARGSLRGVLLRKKLTQAAPPRGGTSARGVDSARVEVVPMEMGHGRFGPNRSCFPFFFIISYFLSYSLFF
jgi:hypothetical protein